jgi:hypothetical protein
MTVNRTPAPMPYLPVVFGLGAVEAAAAIGVSASKFRALVDEGRMPLPRCIDGRRSKGNTSRITTTAARSRRSAPLAMAGSPKIEAPTRDPRTFTEADGLECLAQYRQSRAWPARYWGPPPGEAGCLVPAVLIVKPINTRPAQSERTAAPVGDDLDIADFFRRAAPERLRALALGVAGDEPRGLRVRD